MKYLFIIFYFLVSSCATKVTTSKGVPSFLTQEGGQYYVHLVFNHVPTYGFFLNDQEISHDNIKYQKTEYGHVVKVPVNSEHKDFKVKSSFQTILHRQVRLENNPEKILMLASYSKPVFKAIKKENPHILVAFAPPETIYYKEKDFFDNQLFFQNELRPLYVVGHGSFKETLNLEQFTITNLEYAPFIDRPTFLTHYLPFTYPNYTEELKLVSTHLRKSEVPVIFLSSFPNNLIQQIPRGQLAIPTYEFSVKNHFLALSREDNSPWKMISDLRSDYITLELKFLDSYWHVLVSGKDQNQDLVFSRDLTLYQTKPNEGRNRRNAR